MTVPTDLLAPAATAADVNHDSPDLALDALRTIAAGTLPQQWDPGTVADCLRHVILRHPVTGMAPELGLSVKRTRRLIQELATALRLDDTKKDPAATPEKQSYWLFPVLPDLEVAKTLPVKRRRKAMKLYRELLAEEVPDIWDDALVGNERVSDAARRIRAHFSAEETPPAVLANRFLLRRSALDVRVVSYPTLHAAWRMAQAGLLADLAASDDINPVIAANVVHAYDALEAFRADSVQATKELRAATPETPGLDLLAVRARPLLGGPVTRLERSLGIAPQAKDPSDFTARALREFAHEVSEELLPEAVVDLNDGHILNAARTLGMPLDAPGTTARHEAARKIEELGAVDIDSMLVHLWSVAYAGNRLDDFWSAVEAYASGDPTWCDLLK